MDVKGNDFMSLVDGPDDEEVADPKRSGNVLDRLRGILSESVKLPDIEIEVKQRPGVSVIYSPNIDSLTLAQWRKKASNRKTGELNNVRWACLVVGSTMVEIRVDGETVKDSSGDPLTFMSPTFADMVNVDMSDIVPHGLREFFGVDAHLEATALAILDNSGYGDSVDAEDPTTVS